MVAVVALVVLVIVAVVFPSKAKDFSIVVAAAAPPGVEGSAGVASETRPLPGLGEQHPSRYFSARIDASPGKGEVRNRS